VITKELLDYIKGERAKGVSNEQIKSTLVQNGWLPSDADEAFRSMDVPPPVVSDPVPTLRPVLELPPKHHYARRSAIIFLIVILLLGGSAHAFRDTLKTLPVIRDYFPEEEIPADEAETETEADVNLSTNSNTNSNTDLNTDERFFIGDWKVAGNDFVYIEFIFSPDKTFTLKEYFIDKPNEISNISGKWRIFRTKIYPYHEGDELDSTLELEFRESYLGRPTDPESIQRYKSWGVEFPDDKRAFVQLEVSESGVYSFRWLGTLLAKAYNSTTSENL